MTQVFFFLSGMATYLFFLVKLRVSLWAALSVRYILGIVCRDILNCAVHSVLQCLRERTQSCVDISSACAAVSFLLDPETYRTVHVLSRLSSFAIKLFLYAERTQKTFTFSEWYRNKCGVLRSLYPHRSIENSKSCVKWPGWLFLRAFARCH
jgi:hypothetical protein